MEASMHSLSLVTVYESLGLPPRVSRTLWPNDVSPEAIAAKVVHPTLAIALGADKAVPLLGLASYCANTLDAFFETGARHFLEEADRYWQQLIGQVPPDCLEVLLNRARYACNYF